ncbi:hypothetical protein WDJ51_11285 [Rathayibacter sp. YIM 133350]|uniref:hypothetical protein n=1 Tax=Rathayibacter sp. YIM 133350 TaxID=3131992 RepID=UPI00307DF7F3
MSERDETRMLWVVTDAGGGIVAASRVHEGSADDGGAVHVRLLPHADQRAALVEVPEALAAVQGEEFWRVLSAHTLDRRENRLIRPSGS